jgi:hypothetical protein
MPSWRCAARERNAQQDERRLMWVVWYTHLGLRQSAQVNLRIDPVLKAAAEKVAEAEHWSLTNLIESY